jgi:hypothetical protein
MKWSTWLALAFIGSMYAAALGLLLKALWVGAI